MNLVGPRPLPVAYTAEYSPTEARRLEVKPGLTGLVQVRGRNALTWDEKFALDTWYVEHRTWALDVRILLQTPLVVLRGRGSPTMGTPPCPSSKDRKGRAGTSSTASWAPCARAISLVHGEADAGRTLQVVARGSLRRGARRRRRLTRRRRSSSIRIPPTTLRSKKAIPSSTCTGERARRYGSVPP